MLKVKDSIDLKQLKDLGFKQAGNGEYFYETATSLECIFVQPNRHIYIETKSMYYGAIVEDLLYKLFDLIQEGIIEKEDF